MDLPSVQISRVSNLLRSSVSQRTIADTQRQLLDVQNQLSTGKRLNEPSDDPVDASTALQLRKTLEQRVAYADNLKAAGSQLSEVDSSLSDLNDLLQQAQSIASKDVNADVSAEQRKADAAVVQA